MRSTGPHQPSTFVHFQTQFITYKQDTITSSTVDLRQRSYHTSAYVERCILKCIQPVKGR